MVKVLRSHSYLIDVDPVLVRSFLYLIPFDDLVDFAGQVNVELLDMLVGILNHTPADITYSSVTVRETAFLKGYNFEIKAEIQIWELCFTDSVCCSGTHLRTSQPEQQQQLQSLQVISFSSLSLLLENVLY